MIPDKIAEQWAKHIGRDCTDKGDLFDFSTTSEYVQSAIDEAIAAERRRWASYEQLKKPIRGGIEEQQVSCNLLDGMFERSYWMPRMVITIANAIIAVTDKENSNG